MTTEEGNEIIALYDGFVEDIIHKTYGQLYRQADRLGQFWADKWEYETNWNWLIPVVKKVKAEPIDNRSLIAALTNLEIEPLWQATVEAIQLVNKHKQL